MKTCSNRVRHIWLYHSAKDMSLLADIGHNLGRTLRKPVTQWLR